MVLHSPRAKSRKNTPFPPIFEEDLIIDLECVYIDVVYPEWEPCSSRRHRTTSEEPNPDSVTAKNRLKKGILLNFSVVLWDERRSPVTPKRLRPCFDLVCGEPLVSNFTSLSTSSAVVPILSTFYWYVPSNIKRKHCCLCKSVWPFRNQEIRKGDFVALTHGICTCVSVARWKPLGVAKNICLSTGG